jgi:hypothetical protein
MSDSKDYKVFIDNAGRCLFGEITLETDDFITVKNPVMITVQQQQNGQMAVQLFPLFFAEFVAPRGSDRSSEFTYSKASIATGGDFNIEPRIVDQYLKIVNPELVPNQPVNDNPAGEPEVIKLFDEE